jgi:hypothetical protein
MIINDIGVAGGKFDTNYLRLYRQCRVDVVHPNAGSKSLADNIRVVGSIPVRLAPIATHAPENASQKPVR